MTKGRIKKKPGLDIENNIAPFSLENRKTRANASNVDLIHIMNALESAWFHLFNPSFLATCRRQWQTAKELLDSLEDALRSDIEAVPSIQEHGTAPAMETCLAFLNHSNLLAEIRSVTQEGARGFYALDMDKYFINTAEKMNSNEYQVGFESAGVGSKNASTRFAESVLTYLSRKETLDDILDRNTEE